jgi:hypothetical protein
LLGVVGAPKLFPDVEVRKVAAAGKLGRIEFDPWGVEVRIDARRSSSNASLSK